MGQLGQKPCWQNANGIYSCDGQSKIKIFSLQSVQGSSRINTILTQASLARSHDTKMEPRSRDGASKPGHTSAAFVAWWKLEWDHSLSFATITSDTLIMSSNHSLIYHKILFSKSVVWYAEHLSLTAYGHSLYADTMIHGSDKLREHQVHSSMNVITVSDDRTMN